MLFPDGSLPRTHTNFTYTSGSDFTMHVWYRYVSGETGTYMPQPYITAADWSATFATGSFPVTKEWTQMTPLTGTSGGTVTAMFNLYRSNSGSSTDVVMEFAMPQMEEKSYATPFVREGKGGTGTYNARPASANLMIHGNVGTGQNFSDSSPSKHTITANGDVTHSTAQSKFSGGSIYFDGSDSLQMADSADWNFGAGDYTFDCWIYPTAVNIYGGIINQGEASDNYELNSLMMYTDGTGNIRWLIRNASPTTFVDIKTPSGSIALNNWYHIAAVRWASTGGSATSYKLYINGVESASTTSGTTLMDLSWPMHLSLIHI